MKDKALIAQFRETAYYREVHDYFLSEIDREKKKFFSKDLFSNEEILAEYHKAKATVDTYQAFINKVELIYQDYIKEKPKND